MKGKIFFSGTLLLILVSLFCYLLPPAEAATRTTTKKRTTTTRRSAVPRRRPNASQWRNWQGERPVFPVAKPVKPVTSETSVKGVALPPVQIAPTQSHPEFVAPKRPTTAPGALQALLLTAEAVELEQRLPRFMAEAGLAGAAISGGMIFANPIAPRLELQSGLAFGLGSGYALTILDLARLNFLEAPFNYGLGLSYLMRSDQAGCPALELFIQPEFYDHQWRVAFNTVLGLRGGVVWEWR